ncbi:hypothetical protein MNEG_15079 [Monoraphidium neglectum]|uniref:Uncharacterized protein n=1 Tax=Monoraphidium neglectum TaxID=145388 RepID=A0A0D2LM45_9CHLO|nr:hypothetical protein MNEG_15079 [Monoraphidium neglectum]KIY92884.1 hypothetical protein MNEG_15079 [Monoraphidium neglectum]|eukprot:XP_013891904.1 hypothetical protein MNEG_15079 [Monoraphidium neglectum]
MARSAATQVNISFWTRAACGRPLAVRPLAQQGGRTRLMSAVFGAGASPAVRSGAAALRRLAAPAGRPLGVRAYAVAAAEPAAGKQVEIVKEAHGFELVRHQFVREYDSNVCLYRHKKTGLRWWRQQLKAGAARARRAAHDATATRHWEQEQRRHAPTPRWQQLPGRGCAELISVLNSDENKTFGAVFRTPVGDSTGIPHILP